MSKRVAEPGARTPAPERKLNVPHDDFDPFLPIEDWGGEGKSMVSLSDASGGRMVKAAGKVAGPAYPPSLELAPSFKKTLRYKCTSATAANVTIGDLLVAQGGIAVDSTHVVSWVSAVRLVKLRVWPAAGGTAAVEFNGGISQSKQSVKEMALPTGITSLGGCLTFRPESKTLSSSWYNSGAATTTLFTLTCTIGSVVDVTCDVQLSADYSAFKRTVASATPEVFYYLALDKSGSSLYPPVGLNTTV